MEGNFGLAPYYRCAVEKGQLKLEEHACATLTTGLRAAAAFGVPFMPCGGVDRQGNVRIAGTYHWDRVMSRAAKSVLVVAEEVSDENFADQPELTVVPYFMVQTYAIVKNSAWPGSCWPSYAIDYPAVEAYLEEGAESLARHIDAAPEAEVRQHG